MTRTSHLDLEKAGGALQRRTEVCVVGAGAAGLTLTRRLLAAGHEVLLLESGGIDHEPRSAALNAGQSVGLDYYPLDHARLRFFGGTTAIWGGRCAEFDPIDLETRDWVPGSGWPIAWDDLQGWYREARPLFGLSADAPQIGDLARLGVPAFDGDVLSTPMWTFDPRFNRFSFDSCRDVIDHPRCTVVTHATVTDIQTDPAAGHVTSVSVAAQRGGGRLTVVPRMLVLAAGGIENPRLLLASRSVMAAGLGNAHDQVGRYFMEHPHARGGRIVDGDAWGLLKLFGRRHRLAGRDVAALIAPSAALQRRRGALNSSLTIVARQPAAASQFWGMRVYGGLKHEVSPTRAGRALWMTTKKIASWAQRHIDPARPWLLHKAGKVELALLVRAEQAPNADSRVMLNGETDAVGMPRVTLDWRMSEIDKHSVAVLVEALGDELARLGLGTVEAADWLSDPARLWQSDPLISSHPIGGYHHMGTTRMSSDPRHGVTTGEGRVHGIDNLYIVGSSTFPTSGWANPTLTIAALSLRTADVMSAALQRPVLSTLRNLEVQEA